MIHRTSQLPMRFTKSFMDVASMIVNQLLRSQRKKRIAARKATVKKTSPVAKKANVRRAKPAAKPDYFHLFFNQRNPEFKRTGFLSILFYEIQTFVVCIWDMLLFPIKRTGY
jgi:hypothetical protein